MTTDLSRFAELGLAPALLDAVEDSGYTNPTPVQTQAIPCVIQGADLFASAHTGTGKTASFMLPALHRLSLSSKGRTRPGQPRCLVLTPTRELAAQVEKSAKTYGKYLPLKSYVVFGGVNINPQRMALRKPVDVLIATPGRLMDLVRHNIVRFSDIEILVLDEADRMLDLGFIDEMKEILQLLPETRQSLMFSATYSEEIKKLAHTFLNEQQEISVNTGDTVTELIEHVVHHVDQSRKRALLAKLIKDGVGSQVLVFTKTKNSADRLIGKLAKDKIEGLSIHGDKSQGARTNALSRFKSGSLQVLVATDLAARGIDIENLTTVVNYELPHVPENYIHRIGRTGRAGSSGLAISLVNIDEIKLLKGIEKLLGQTIPRVSVDGFTGHTEAPGSTLIDTVPKPSRRKRFKNQSEG